MKYYIGIDLGGTNVRTLLVDENGQSYSEVKDATEREKGPDAVTAKICRQIEAIDYTVCGGIENVEGIGIGVPGPVDVVKGVMIMASNLPGFENYPIAEKLSTKFNKPVFLDNDANVAGLAEAELLPVSNTVSSGIAQLERIQDAGVFQTGRFIIQIDGVGQAFCYFQVFPNVACVVGLGCSDACFFIFCFFFLGQWDVSFVFPVAAVADDWDRIR